MTKKKHGGGPPIGSQNRLVHGGAGAVQRISRGEPFIGYQLEVYEGVVAELGIDLDALPAIDRIRWQHAIQEEAAYRMFVQAGRMHAASGDLEQWERMQQRAGWIGGRAFTHLTALAAERKTGDLILDAVIEASK